MRCADQARQGLRFASLPEGDDPDHLVHAAGEVAEVLVAARPLADVLWMREAEAGRSIPRARAALKAASM